MILMLLIFILLIKIFTTVKNLLYKMKMNKLLDTITEKEDLLYLRFKDYMYIIMEIFRRKGYLVKFTNNCGIDGSGLKLKLDSILYAEVWKHGLNQVVEVELAMNLAKCMQSNSIYRGILITLGDFKLNTKAFCHKNVIECINGDQLLNMCKEAQKSKAVLETAK
jgi:restriction system protein